MEEYIGLIWKIYCYKLFKNKKPKFSKIVVQKEICFEDFRECLLTKEPIYKKQNLFRTNKRYINNIEQNKKALNFYDNKQLILNNGIDNLTWLHYSINIPS